MTQTDASVREEIRRLVETTTEPIPAIAARFGLHHFVIYNRMRREHWHDPREQQLVTAAPAASTPVILGAATAFQPEPAGDPAPSSSAPQRRSRSEPGTQPESCAQHTISSFPSSTTPRRPQPSVLGNPARLKAIANRIMATIVRRVDILEEQLTPPKRISPQDGERIDRAIRYIMMNFEKARAIHAQLELEQRSSKRSTLNLEAQRRALAERIERLNQEWLARRGRGQAQQAGDEATRADLAGEVDQGRPEQPDPAGPG